MYIGTYFYEYICSIYKNNISLYSFRATSLTSNLCLSMVITIPFTYYIVELVRATELSIKLSFSNYPLGTSKVFYCRLQIMYSTMFWAPFHVL